MEHGIITSVKYKQGVVLCNVQAIRVDTEYTEVPVLRTFSGTIEMPQQGQKVAMTKLDDGTRFIVGTIAKEDDYPTSRDEGEMTIQVDSGTKIELTKNSNGNYDLDLSASGTINISGTTDVVIDGIDFDKHTHDYGDTTVSDTSDGTGTASTTTETTNPPK